MLRIWKLAALLALAVPAFAAAQAAEPADQSAQILKKLDDLQKSIDKLQNDTTMGTLKVQQALEDIGKLKEQVGQLRQDLDSLRNQSITRVAKSPANTTGRIQLVNVYPEQMTVLVNQTAYRLAPGEVRTLESQPVGAFLYQVLGAQTAPQSRLLAANETFTITVYPR